MVEGLLPFTTAAMEAPIPEKSTSSVFKRYDGSADSDEHLRSFVNTMVFYSRLVSGISPVVEKRSASMVQYFVS